MLRRIVQHERPVFGDQTYPELSLFLVIWDFRPVCLIGQRCRHARRQPDLEHQIFIVRQHQIGVGLFAVRADDLHMVPPVGSDCGRSLVSRVVSRNHGIFRSRVIVAAIRRGETIGGAGLRLAVDGHRLDAGGRFTIQRRVADGEGVRAGISIDVILDGVALAVLQHLQHRRLRVRFHHMAAHIAEQLVLFRVPAAGCVLAITCGLRCHRVTRLTLHVPARPDVARLPVDPAEVVLPVAGVVDQLHLHRFDRPAVVLHVRQRQQLHIDTPVFIGNQNIIEIPEEGELVVAVDGLRLNLQLHQLSMV